MCDPPSWVRYAAVETLGKLPPEVLATHDAALLAKLEDSDSEVRYVAVATLGKLPPEVLAAHAAALLAKLEDSERTVWCAAVEILGKLPPEVLTTHGLTTLSLLDSELLEAQLRGSEWSSSEGEGIINQVDVDLKWNQRGMPLDHSIVCTGALVTTNGWWVVRMSATAGHVESVQWQESLLDGADVLTWTRLA